MRQSLKSVYALLAAGLMCFTFLLPAAANSALKSWSGVNGAALSPAEQCPVRVAREQLTIRVDRLPGLNGAPGEADVTAEYTLENPTDEEIRVRLMFPVGQKPDYAETNGSYGVAVNGKETAVTRRFSYPAYTVFNAQRELEKLRDDMISDGFLRPDLPVTEYAFAVNDPPENAAATLTYTGEYPAIVYFTGEEELFYTSSAENTVEFNAVSAFHVAVLGGAAQTLTCAFKDGETNAPLPDLQAEKTEETQYTLQSFLAANAPADSPIPETDRYNAAVQWLKDADAAGGRLLLADENSFLNDTVFMEWYEYTLAFAPGETLVNTVNAPFFPAADARKQPPVFTYTYLLSPAAGWADFGTLDVEIVTPFYLLDSSLDGFEQKETGFALHTQGLPEKELELTLCASPNPKRDPEDLKHELLIITMAVLGLLFCAGALAAVVLLARKAVQAAKAKRAERNK